MTPRDELLLRSYFDGSFEAAMGLQSWLGDAIDRRGMPASKTYAVPPEPGPEAIRAVEDERMVRLTLGRIAVHHRRVLRARYTPVAEGYPAGLGELGEYRVVVAMLEGLEVARAAMAAGCVKDRRKVVARMATRAQQAITDALGAYEAAFAGVLAEVVEERRRRRTRWREVELRSLV